MGALERTQIVFVATDQIRRHGQQLEIFTDEGRGLIGARERIVGIGPVSLRIARPTLLKFAGHVADVWLLLIKVAHGLHSASWAKFSTLANQQTATALFVAFQEEHESVAARISLALWRKSIVKIL